MKTLRESLTFIFPVILMMNFSFGQSNSWMQKAGFPGSLAYGAVGFSIGPVGYVGMSSDSIDKKEFWSFDPVMNVWTQRADYGGYARLNAVGFAIGNKGYMGTGMDIVFGLLNDFWEYDPVFNTWTQKSSFGYYGRENAVGFAVNGKGYVATGLFNGTYLNEVWEFDPGANSWVQKNDFPGLGRDGAVGFSIGNKGYLGTGHTTGYYTGLNDFWEYDPLFDTWSRKSDFGGAERSEAVAFAVAGRGYIGTGSGANAWDDFWEYDPQSDTWTEKEEFPGEPRGYATGFSIGNKGYLGTGMFGTPINHKDFWEYTPNGFLCGLIPGVTFCTGNTLSIPFTISTACKTGNIFSAELSDSAGSFSQPVLIGILQGTGSGMITGEIPAGIPDGTRYRIRVISSDPASISVDNMIDLAIHHAVPGPAATIAGTLPGCLNHIVSYGVPGIPGTVEYMWTIPAGLTGNNSHGNMIQLSYNTGFVSGALTVRGRNACGNGPSSGLTLSMTDCGDRWIKRSDEGWFSRNGALAFSIGGKGYCGTGVNNDSDNHKDFWEYSPNTDTWSQKADCGNSGRSFSTGFSIGTKGYAGIGVVSSPGYSREFWEFDPLMNNWTQKADFGGTSRYGATGFSIGNKGYAGMGIEQYTYKKDFWEYDPLLNTWTQKADFGGTERQYATGFSIGSKGYLGTGYDGSPTNDFWEYEPQLNTWVQKASLEGLPRYHSAGFSVNGKGYIGTGYAINYHQLQDLWEFDPLLDTWTRRADYGGTPRSEGFGFSIGSRGYIGSGVDFDLPGQDHFWEYVPANFSVGLLKGISFCTGSHFTVPFIYPGSCNPGNVFTVQLSDSSGNFTTPASIGSLVSNLTGSVQATIPAGTLPGTKYRIRVVSSNPYQISTDNQINLAVSNTLPSATGDISGPVPACVLKTNTYSVDQVQNAFTYKWLIPPGIAGNGSIGNSMQLTCDSGFVAGNLIVSGHNGCGDGPSSMLALSATNCGGYWHRRADMTGPGRYSAAGFSAGAKGYIGTAAQNIDFTEDFREFDPVSNTWQQKANYAGNSTIYASCFSIQGKGYVGTGIKEDQYPRKDFWQFDPVANTWSQKADFGGTARKMAVGFSIGAKGYIGTGTDGNIQKKDFWEYNPVTNSWSQKADFGGAARKSAAGFSIGNKGYVGTGWVDGYSKDFWEFDPALNTWTTRADFGGTARAGAVGFSIGGKGYLGTGDDGIYHSDFWEFDPGNNSWTRKEEFEGLPRSGAVGFAIGDRGYISTGSTYGGGVEKDIWEYTPQGFFTGFPGTNQLCAGAPVSVPFSFPGICDAPNVFTAQLSDSLGNFSNPVNIGTLASLISDTIPATIPAATPRGPGYRIRVTSSQPPAIATDDLIDISIHQLPPGPAGVIAGPALVCNTKSGVYQLPLIPGSLSYQWSIPTGAAGNGSCWNNLALTFDSGFVSGTLQVRGRNGCGSGDSSTMVLTGTDCGDYWVRKAGMTGLVRYSAVGFSIGNKGYIGTGYTYGYSRDFWEFDPVSNTWTQKADFGGTARAGATGFSIGLKGYVGTGIDGSQGSRKRDFWEFDPQLNTWTQKTDFGGTARSNATGFAINGKGYVGTGYDGTTRKDFWEYNPASDTWLQKADFGGTGRQNASSFSIGNKGYVGTGFDGGGIYGNYLRDFWEFDPLLNSWIQKTNFVSDRSYAIGFSIDDKGYFALGRDPASYRDKIDLWQYDPVLNTWNQKYNYSGNASLYAVGFSIGNRGFAGTGQNLNYFDPVDFWEYIPDNFGVGLLSSISFCTGSSIVVPFTFQGACNPGNIFTAQLSDLSGSFTSPTVIGTLPGTMSGSIACTIPANTPDGTKYRIRVVSSNPAGISVNNLVDLSIHQAIPPAAGIISGAVPACLLKPGIFTIPTIANAVSYKWTVPSGATGNGSTGSSVNIICQPSFTAGLVGVYAQNGCGAGLSSSLPLTMTDCGDNWVRKADLISARIRATGFSIGNKGYIGAGTDSSDLKDFWEFDPVMNTWAQKADCGKKARQHAVGFSIRDKGYFGLGYNGAYRKDFWEYDAHTNYWTQVSDFPGTGRIEAVAFSIGANGYVGTGHTTFNNYFRDFWEYSPATNTWNQKADFGGTGRYSATGFSINNKGYLGTGFSDGYVEKNDFWAYDPSLNNWTQIADFGGEARRGAVGFSIGGKGYTGTGFRNNNYYYSDFWEYNPDMNTWIRKADFAGTPRTYATGFAIGNRGFIGTGADQSSTRKKDLWEYTPDGFRPGLLADNAFCGGSQIGIPYTVTTPCTPGNAFTAQLSDSLGNFTNPVNIGMLTTKYSDTIRGMLPAVTSNSAKYRIRVVSSSPSSTSTDNLYDLSLFAPTLAGLVNGSKTIALGSPTDTLRINGYTGNVIKWQKQVNGNGFSDISQTAGLVWYLETPTQAGTWEYRSVIKNGSCSTEISTPADIAVVQGPLIRYWNGNIDDKWYEAGNWSPTGVPGALDDVVIPATAPHMPVVRWQGYSCNNMLIRSGAACTLNPGIVLTVNGILTIEGQY